MPKSGVQQRFPNGVDTQRKPSGVRPEQWEVFCRHVNDGVTITQLADTLVIPKERVQKVLYRISGKVREASAS